MVVDFKDSRVWDHSGLQAIDSLAERYSNYGKQLHLKHLSADCTHLLRKADSLVEVNVIEDPHYGIVVDYADLYREDSPPSPAGDAASGDGKPVADAKV